MGSDGLTSGGSDDSFSFGFLFKEPNIAEHTELLKKELETTKKLLDEARTLLSVSIDHGLNHVGNCLFENNFRENCSCGSHEISDKMKEFLAKLSKEG